MAHNVIPWRRVVSLYKSAISGEASHDDAVTSVSQQTGLEPHVVEWCVAAHKTEDEKT
jgi:hypothetical protein